MKVGDKTVTALKLGTVNISRAYLGSTLVWEAGGVPGEPFNLISDLVAAPGGANQFQVGWGFTALENFTAVGGRIYGQDPGLERFYLWRVSDQQLLATVDISVLQNTWVEGMFDSPVALSSGEEYRITMRRTNGASRARNDGSIPSSSFSDKIAPIRAYLSTTTGFPASAGSTSAIWGVTDLICE